MSILPQPTESISEAMTRASPPIAVSGLTLWGVALPDIVQVLTAIYIVLLVAEKGYRFYRKYKEDKHESKK